MNWNKTILEKAGWQIDIGEDVCFATHELSGRILKLESTKSFRSKYLVFNEYMHAQEIKFCKDALKIISEATDKGHL
jgi:hypothetical protein